MAGRLARKVCIITGTGGSAGRAAALTFAREGARLVDLAVSEFGRIDVLYNLAAQARLHSFHLPAIAHTTNKAAIIGMTRQLAMEGSEHGIRVNSISPGPDRKQRDPRGASGRAVGPRDAGPDTALPVRPAGGRGERRVVPCVRRELLRDGYRPRADRIGHQPPSGEPQRLRRGVVQPLLVIHHAHERPFSRRLGQQAQHGQANQEPVPPPALRPNAVRSAPRCGPGRDSA